MCVSCAIRDSILAPWLWSKLCGTFARMSILVNQNLIMARLPWVICAAELGLPPTISNLKPIGIAAVGISKDDSFFPPTLSTQIKTIGGQPIKVGCDNSTVRRTLRTGRSCPQPWSTVFIHMPFRRLLFNTHSSSLWVPLKPCAKSLSTGTTTDCRYYVV